jgi:hypothetical protein
VVIAKYIGEDGKLVIPAEIEGLPVVELDGEPFSGKDYGPGSDLTSVAIPAGVKTIRGNVFEECEKPTTVTIQGSGVALGWFSFGGRTELTELVFPDGEKTLAPYEAEYQLSGTTAFYDCKKLPLAMRANSRQWVSTSHNQPRCPSTQPKDNIRRLPHGFLLVVCDRRLFDKMSKTLHASST